MQPVVLQDRPSTALQMNISPASIVADRRPAVIFSMRCGKVRGRSG